MTRLLYSLLWFLGMPLVLGRLMWRARRQPAYLQNLGERFGRVKALPAPCIWLHAVSVGETRAAQPLVKALLRDYPTHQILVTHMTPTGRATGLELFGKESRVRQAWLPYDLPWLMRRFLKKVQPDCGIVMETEVWPNLMRQANALRIPMLLANARLSARSANGYARLGTLARQAFSGFDCIAAQSAADAERLRTFASKQAVITGNIKHDVEIPAAMKELGARFNVLVGDRPVVLATSTREGEEALLLEAFLEQTTVHHSDDILFVLVPRHPQRFDEVAELIQHTGLVMQRRSEEQPINAATRVLLGDSMGEMAAYYSMADVSLIGGSWLPFGSQNLIESCAAGVPVMVGPHTFNFADAADKAVEAGAALRCPDAAAGISAALNLLSDDEHRQMMGEAGLAFCKLHGGATAKLMKLIAELLQKP